MPSYVTPKNGAQYIMYVGLESVATAGTFQSNPTLASGDFKVSTDGGALANLTTLPTVTPASGKMVKITLSAAEMTGDNITVVCSDVAGGEWRDLIINIQTSARQIDDLATPTNITAGTITTVTNLTNAPTNGDLTATMKVSVTTAATSATPTVTLDDGAITAAKIAADAITAAKIADGAIDAATFAAGAITASAIAADAITDAKVASDVTIASVTGAVGSVTGNVGGNVVGSVASVTSGVTVTTNNDKTGYALSSAGIQAIWDALTSTLTTIGSIGKLLVDNIDATISSRLASASYSAPPSVSAIRTEMDNNSTKLANLDATVASRATPAQVNTEVLDVLSVDTFGEPTSAPAATSTLVAKLQWLFTLARNKLTQTATTQSLRNDADSANIATSTVADDGTTLSRGEWS